MSYDILLHRFTSKDSRRPAMQQAHLSVQTVFATDGTKAMAIPASRLTGKYYAVPKYPNVEVLFADAFCNAKHKPMQVNPDRLRDMLALIPKVPDYEECEYCHGYKKVECTCCGHKHECTACDGSGNAPNPKGEKPADNHFVIIGLPGFGRPAFRGVDLELLLEIQGVTKKPLMVVANTEKGLNLFETDEIMMAIVAHSYSLEEEEKAVFHTYEF